MAQAAHSQSLNMADHLPPKETKKIISPTHDQPQPAMQDCNERSFSLLTQDCTELQNLPLHGRRSSLLQMKEPTNLFDSPTLPRPTQNEVTCPSFKHAG